MHFREQGKIFVSNYARAVSRQSLVVVNLNYDEIYTIKAGIQTNLVQKVLYTQSL